MLAPEYIFITRLDFRLQHFYTERQAWSVSLIINNVSVLIDIARTPYFEMHVRYINHMTAFNRLIILSMTSCTKDFFEITIYSPLFLKYSCKGHLKN